jgi:hypothetical protein
MLRFHLPLFQPTFKILSLDVDMDTQTAKVRGRPKGFLAFLASLFGMGREHTWRIDREGFHEDVRAPRSETRTYVPWEKVSSCVFTRTRKFLLIFGKNSISVGVITDGGSEGVMRVEPRGDQAEDMKDIYKILRGRMKEVYAGSSSSRSAPYREERQEAPSARYAPPVAVTPAPAPPPAPPAAAYGEMRITTCPHCTMRMKVPGNAGGKRIACPSCQQPFLVNFN